MAERKLPESTEALEKRRPERVHANAVAKRVPVPRKKRTAADNFKELFFADDIGDIGGYLLKDLIVPAIKDTFMDFMYALLFGSRKGPGSSRVDGRSRTNYSSYGRGSSRIGIDRDRGRSSDRDDISASRKNEAPFNLDNIIVNTREEADVILTRMEEYIDVYDGQVPVGYLFELLGEPCPYTSEYWGWRNLDNARVRHVRNGHIIDFPNPVRLEK